MTDVPREAPPGDARDALIREQAQQIKEQAQQIKEQAQQIKEQAQQITALEAVVADLRGRLEAAERSGSHGSTSPGSTRATRTSRRKRT